MVGLTFTSLISDGELEYFTLEVKQISSNIHVDSRPGENIRNGTSLTIISSLISAPDPHFKKLKSKVIFLFLSGVSYPNIPL
jgi:hypothetical protein